MGKFYTLLFSILIYCNASAQNEANNWYFGNLAGITFNSGSAVALTNGQLNTLEGCSSISDASGNLLFYTDGTRVWNRNHAVMTNGTGLKGNSISSQSGIIVPKPGSSSIYYIFTNDFQGGLYGPSAAYPDGKYDGFMYSEVDMTLSTGLGAVVAARKNVVIKDTTTESLAAVRHSNKIDYWVVVHGTRDNKYYSYLVTSAGVNTTPVISATGPDVFVNSINSGKGANGIIKISPDGKKIAATHYGYLDLTNTPVNKDLVISDFNTATGVVSNSITVPIMTTIKSEGPYGIEFSNCSEYLYATESSIDTLNSRVWPLESRVWRFDMNAGDIAASKTLFNYTANEYFGALQLATDGKIYCARIPRVGGSPATYDFNPSGGNTLHAINNPRFATATFSSNAINLSGRYSKLGLPPFISTFFYNTSISATNLTTGDSVLFCQGDSVLFRGNTSSFDSIRWNFNDAASGALNNTSTIRNPRHLFSSGGTYQVTLLRYLCDFIDTTRKNITITNYPVVNDLTDITVCSGTTVLIDATSAPATSYLWNTGATTPTITSDSTGKYIVTVSNNGCKAKDSMFLKQIISATAAVSISSDLSNSICEGSTVLFTANPDASLPTTGISYQWYRNGMSLNGDTTGTYSSSQINDGDTFSVRLTVSAANTCLVGSNIATNNFPVTVRPVPVMSSVANQTLCFGDNTAAVSFSSNLTSTDFNWTNSNTSVGLGANGTGNIPAFAASNGGQLSLTATITVTPVKNGCNGTAQVYSYTVNDCSLPVELINFDGNKIEDFVNNLYWTTASEYNSDFFSLEHSQDISVFKEIYTVKGAGNSNQIKNYSYLHKEVPPGINYYRLKQVDLDGKYTYSDIVKIINQNDKYTAVVYPNPASDNITVLINNPAGNSRIMIFDALGQIMQYQEAQEDKNLKIELNISHFANGMYYILISDSRNKTTVPVLKQ